MFRLRIEKLEKKLSPEFTQAFHKCNDLFNQKFRSRIGGTRDKWLPMKVDPSDEGSVNIVDEIHAELFLIIHQMNRLMDAMVFEKMMHQDAREELSGLLMNIYDPVTKKDIGGWKIEERGIHEVLREEENTEN